MLCEHIDTHAHTVSNSKEMWLFKVLYLSWWRRTCGIMRDVGKVIDVTRLQEREKNGFSATHSISINFRKLTYTFKTHYQHFWNDANYLSKSSWMCVSINCSLYWKHLVFSIEIFLFGHLFPVQLKKSNNNYLPQNV